MSIALQAARRPIQGLTIDPPGSRDLDDAVWYVWDDERGQHRITVAVTDITEMLDPHGPIVVEAHRRGQTIYHSRGSRPMLPDWLSEQSGSLFEAECRPVLAVEIALGDSYLDLRSVDVFLAELHSAARLTYSEVAAIVAGEQPSPHQSMLRQMSVVASQLLEQRRAAGALAVYDVDQGWGVSEEGRVYRLTTNERNVGYVLVQELMILTNTTLAELFVRTRLPGLFRNHSLADTEDRDRLVQQVAAVLAGNLETGDMPAVASRLRFTPASYDIEPRGHYALNRPAYLHATSPLRRYADLANMLNLTAHLRGEPLPFTREDLAHQAETLNTQIAAAQQAQSAYFKAVATHKAAEQLAQATAESLAVAPVAAFRRIFKLAALEEIPPAMFTRAVFLRAAAHTLAPREVLALLYETPRTAAWEPIRSTALADLRNRPGIAVSLLVIAEDRYDWSPVLYHIREDRDRFVCQAALARDGEIITTGEVSGRAKKEAQQGAAVELCYLLAGYAPPVSSDVHPGDSQELVDPASPVLIQAHKGDYISALMVLAARTGVRPPEFRVVPAGGVEPGMFCCHVTWPAAGVTASLEATARGKQAARQAAAARLLLCLQQGREACSGADTEAQSARCTSLSRQWKTSGRAASSCVYSSRASTPPRRAGG